jgi:hypothetical protein
MAGIISQNTMRRDSIIMPPGFFYEINYHNMTVRVSYHKDGERSNLILSENHSTDFFESPELRAIVFQSLMDEAKRPAEVRKSRKVGIQYDF